MLPSTTESRARAQRVLCPHEPHVEGSTYSAKIASGGTGACAELLMVHLAMSPFLSTRRQRVGAHRVSGSMQYPLLYRARIGAAPMLSWGLNFDGRLAG